MAISMQSGCACSNVAIYAPTWKGAEPSMLAGKLLQESGITIRPGDFVKYNTTSDGWENIATGDSIGDGDLIGVVRSLKHYQTGEIKDQVSVNSEAFLNAVIWQHGGGSILCSSCYLWNGSARVAFAPETHTSLAAQLGIHLSNGIDGSKEDYYFTFK